jgi:hypothetical protein
VLVYGSKPNGYTTLGSFVGEEGLGDLFQERHLLTRPRGLRGLHVWCRVSGVVIVAVVVSVLRWRPRDHLTLLALLAQRPRGGHRRLVATGVFRGPPDGGLLAVAVRAAPELDLVAVARLEALHDVSWVALLVGDVHRSSRRARRRASCRPAGPAAR